jgi:hypothetical protein
MATRLLAVVSLVLVAAAAAALAGGSPRSVAYFERPGGNIRCVISKGSGRRALAASRSAPGAAQVVAGQRSRELRFSRVGPLQAADALPYGKSIGRLGFVCCSRKVGLSCVDSRTRRGFRIAREVGVIERNVATGLRLPLVDT